MADELLNGGALIKFEMERRSKEITEGKERDRKEKLIAQSRALRFLKQDEFVMSLREEAIKQRDFALAKIIDPSKMGKGETLETISIEARCHQKYVDLFDTLENIGKNASQTLQKEAKAKREEDE